MSKWVPGETYALVIQELNGELFSIDENQSFEIAEQSRAVVLHDWVEHGPGSYIVELDDDCRIERMRFVKESSAAYGLALERAFERVDETTSALTDAQNELRKVLEKMADIELRKVGIESENE